MQSPTPWPRIIAHRGGPSLEPENTLRAFRRVEALGVDGIELDLRVTADGRLVVIHDATLDRTTNGTGPVRDRTLAELQRLDAGMGERIPTFEQVLEATKLPIQTELKTDEALEPLLHLLSREHGRNRILPICFDADVLRRLHSHAPSITIGLLANEASRNVIEQACRIGASFVSLRAASVHPAAVERCRKANLEVSVWTVNAPTNMRRMIRLAVDAIVTDRPHVLARVLRDEAMEDPNNPPGNGDSSRPHQE